VLPCAYRVIATVQNLKGRTLDPSVLYVKTFPAAFAISPNIQFWLVLVASSNAYTVIFRSNWFREFEWRCIPECSAIITFCLLSSDRETENFYVSAVYSRRDAIFDRLSYRRFSAKLVSTFADRGSHVASVTDPYGRILGFLDRSRYFFFQVAPQLYSWGWKDPSENLVAPAIEPGPLDL
jgi:hypothetical protein